jgi:hypothetical protein
MATSALTPTPLSQAGEGHIGGENPFSRSRETVAGDNRPDQGLLEVEAAIDRLDWIALDGELDALGCAVAPKLLTPQACRGLATLYGDDARFRSRIVMASHGFGRGEYKYFAEPLPELVGALRRDLYRRLAPIADRWNAAMGVPVRYPAEHEAFRARCRAAGQARPTPLLLRYGPGDYNCLHQDVYGEHLSAG